MAGIPPGSERQAVGPRIFAFLMAVGIFFLPTLAFGQSAIVSGTSQGVPAGMQFKVLDQQKLSFGKHSLTFNRIAPPLFPAATPASSPPLITAPRYAKYECLTFWASVYNHRFTVLEWIGQGNAIVAVSNVDLNYFCYTGGFAETDAYYNMVAFLDNESMADADATTAGWLAEARESLKPGTPGYLIVSGTASPDQIQALNDLHTYYAANSDALVQTFTAKQAQWAKELLQLKLHPPVRPDTVINYWPIKSSVYPTGSGQ